MLKVNDLFQLQLGYDKQIYKIDSWNNSIANRLE